MKFLFHIFYAILWLLAWLPLGVLYIISDAMFVWVYFIAGYRKKIVRKNLQNSFPDKTKKELRHIERKFYLHFCDIWIETIKLIHISDKEMRKRFVLKNSQLLDDFYAKNQNAIVYLGHYGNWEWTNFGRKAIQNHQHEYKSYSIYHPLRNRFFDTLMINIRSKSGCVLVPQKKVMRTMIETKRNNAYGFFCFIADQRPRRSGTAYWQLWLNQETAPIVGPEKLAVQTDFPVLYLDVQKPKRGHYIAELVMMTEDARNLPEFELTKEYMRLIENTIVRNPAYWLWTHKRWKRKKE